MQSLEEIKPMVSDLASWKPTMVKAVADLREEMGELRQQVSQIARNPVLHIKPGDLLPILSTSNEAWAGVVKEEERKFFTTFDRHGPSVHDDQSMHRGKAVVGNESPKSLSDKGMHFAMPLFP
uniref:Uncharacterized protein n=1 Tax=Leersia perrieri TaxID=77586 RepID=A0A0D9XXI9_9ORYZ